MGDEDMGLLASNRVNARLSLTGQLVPPDMQNDAGRLLACVWLCGNAVGVTLEEWRLVVPDLPQLCIDLVILSHREEDGDGGDGS